MIFTFGMMTHKESYVLLEEWNFMLDTRLGYASICKRVAGHTYWEIFFWRRGISFCFGSFMFPLTAAIFSFKCRNSRAAMGVKSIRPTWFEDETAAKTTAEPMHGLRLIIKEDVPPLGNHPRFEALEEVAKRGLLAAETWHCNRPHVSLKTTVAGRRTSPRHSH